MSLFNRGDDDGDETPLPYGGEIYFSDPDEDCHVPDRIEFLPGGFVMGIYKHNYEIIVYHPDEIARIYTHTNHLEDKDWWDPDE